MANKTSNNPIQSYSVDGTEDPLTHKPFSGLSIQNYIRANFEILETRLTAQEIINLLNLT